MKTTNNENKAVWVVEVKTSANTWVAVNNFGTAYRYTKADAEWMAQNALNAETEYRVVEG